MGLEFLPVRGKILKFEAFFYLGVGIFPAAGEDSEIYILRGLRLDFSREDGFSSVGGGPGECR